MCFSLRSVLTIALTLVVVEDTIGSERERDIKFLIRNLFVTLFDFVKSIHDNSSSPLVGSFKVNSFVRAKRIERLSLLCCKVVFSMGKDN